jgi:glutamyl-tRNA synthetase
MGLFNVGGLQSEKDNMSCQFLGETSENEKTPIIQWVPSDENVTVRVVMPDATIITGLAESGLKSENEGAIIQFVRFGFCRLDQKADDTVSVYFAHQ